jgi:hypothetical protein
MPQHKGYLLTISMELYWMIWDCLPELRCFVHHEVYDGHAYVYFERQAPEKVLELIDKNFFSQHGMRSDSWVPTFRFPWPGEKWVLYDAEKHAHFPDGFFGWRLDEQLLIETESNVVQISGSEEETHMLQLQDDE